uniref:Uncharacterized protein n=1 Tax=Rhizophora mucronata TaxID=61149 RepID=A0A2P2IL12_RHIMU
MVNVIWRRSRPPGHEPNVQIGDFEVKWDYDPVCKRRQYGMQSGECSNCPSLCLGPA